MVLDLVILKTLTLFKVEGEKNYHLRIAAILGDVEAEVSSAMDSCEMNLLSIQATLF